jgi:CIC family chloride channel protein
MQKQWSDIIEWRQRHVRDKQFMLFLAFVIGVLTALAGLLLKWIIHQIGDLLTHHFSITGLIL